MRRSSLYWLLLVSTCLALVWPQAASAATVLGAYAIINAPLVNVREGPGTSFAVVKSLTEGDSIAVIGRSADCAWLQVVVPNQGPGWLASQYVILSQVCKDLPAVTAPPTTSAATKQSAPASTTTASTNLATAAAPTPTAVPAGPPTASSAGCTGTAEHEYHALTVDSAPTSRPAASHPDLNLAMRSYRPAGEVAALQSFGPVHEVDLNAPQLRNLFADGRQASVNAVYQVFDWDWGCNCLGAPLDSPPVTLVGFAVTPGEALLTPDSPRTIGDGYEALVLYATASQLTLKFTREDNVISGYTLHVEGICVDPGLVALYNTLNQAGRGQLPALRGGQSFGRAQSDTVLVGIRDNGQFLDPRYLENWWR